MKEKQEINITQKHVEQKMNLASDTAFVQSSAGSSGKTWGRHGLVHDLDQYSVDGIKKNKKEDAEAPCSMEVMAIQPMAQTSTTFMPCVPHLQIDSHVSTSTMHMQTSTRNVNKSINMPYGKINHSNKCWDKFH